MAVGVDWASGHWIAVVVGDGSEVRVRAHPSILAAWRAHRERGPFLVDVPIGLPGGLEAAGVAPDGRRLCDRQARELLPAETGSSVFATPARTAAYADDYDAAAAANETTLDRGLSVQSWGIVPQIRAVDAFLRTVEAARGTVRECHPEVAFASLADDPVVERKDTDAGRERRLAVLDREPRPYRERYEAVRGAAQGAGWKRRITTGRLDDVVDAMALAATADRGPAGWTTLPPDPPTDDEGLPMEIVRPRPA